MTLTETDPPIIVERYGDAVEAWTQVQQTQVVYEVRRLGTVRWQQVVRFPDHNRRHRMGAAREQERVARQLAE